MSGRGPNVYFVDTITCQTIEEIYIPEIKKIYQHRTQPQNNASIAGMYFKMYILRNALDLFSNKVVKKRLAY